MEITTATKQGYVLGCHEPQGADRLRLASAPSGLALARRPGGNRRRFVMLLTLVLLGATLATARADQGGTLPLAIRDSRGPVKIPGVTIPNFGVVDGRILRGSLPREEQVAELVGLGVRTLVELSAKPNERVRERAERLGVRYVSIAAGRRRTPTDASVGEFLRIATDAAQLPLYVCCTGGRHRTGAFVAVYRVAVNGWPAREAVDEMDAYGFYTVLWLHLGFKRYVVDYDRRMRADPASVPLALPGRGTSRTTPSSECTRAAAWLASPTKPARVARAHA